ncbi:GTPase [Robiginitalea sp. SC105]|uniref:GTPase n=1 Tax=Robiginitalea sp. SC105 TaxID=2762332 RepID=UPI00163AD062|nr:GTPase [Robiginitalea sp. SC105]MBC2838974.1 GTPase [Robiginitalea sp. SC105]
MDKALTALLDDEGALIFVYNADTGWRQAFWDTLHKYMRPETYGCNLCKLTHGPIGPKETWKAFLRDVGRPVHFLHRDEYRQLQAESDLDPMELPAVLRIRGGRPEILIPAREMNGMDRLEDLVSTIRERLER